MKNNNPWAMSHYGAEVSNLGLKLPFILNRG